MPNKRNKFLWNRTLRNSGWRLDPAFEDRFRKEITKTELLRVNILVIAIVSVFCSGLINLYFQSTDKAASALKSGLGILSYSIAFILIYEIIVAVILWRQVREHQPVSRWLRIMNILIETSFPTAFCLILFMKIQNVMVMFTPVLSVYFLFIVLSTLHLNFWMSVATGAIAFVEYYGVSLFIIYHTQGDNTSPFISSPVLLMGRSVLLLLSGFAAGFVALEIKKRMNVTFHVMIERGRIRQILGQQVSHAVVDRIINEGIVPRNERRMVCIMFLDVRNFTPFVSGRSPEEVMDYQNKLFGIAIDSVNKYNGIINQFLGDGFMATFGAPVSSGNDCKNGVDAAMEILDETEKAVDQKLISPTRLGIGLHYGEAITGNIGTALRKQYSIIGNVVIQASRIEQLNKEFQSQFLISKDVLERIDGLPAKSLGKVMLKGEREPLEIFRIR